MYPVNRSNDEKNIHKHKEKETFTWKNIKRIRLSGMLWSAWHSMPLFNKLSYKNHCFNRMLKIAWDGITYFTQWSNVSVFHFNILLFVRFSTLWQQTKHLILFELIYHIIVYTLWDLFSLRAKRMQNNEINRIIPETNEGVRYKCKKKRNQKENIIFKICTAK